MSREVLEPRLVVAAGFAATGKTTTMEILAGMIPNGVFISYGEICDAMLNIPTSPKPRLPHLKEYVARDAVPYDPDHLVQTPYGEMLRVTPTQDTFGRHVLIQARLVMAKIAAKNMQLGKVAIIDSATPPDYLRGTLRIFFEMDRLRVYPQYHIHFVANEQDAYKRGLARLQGGDLDSIARDQERLSSPDAFHHFATQIQPMYPKELSDYRHKLVNTSDLTPQEAAQACYEYILGAPGVLR